MTKIWTHKEELLLEVCKELLPKFVELAPKEAAEAAVSYATALIKELENEE